MVQKSFSRVFSTYIISCSEQKKLEENKIKTREKNKGRKIKTLLSSPIHLAHHRSTVEPLSLGCRTDIATLPLCCRSDVIMLSRRYCSAVAPPLSLRCRAAVTPLSHRYRSTVSPLLLLLLSLRSHTAIVPLSCRCQTATTPQRRKTHAPDSHQWSLLP